MGCRVVGIVVLAVLVWLAPIPATAQESCEDTLAWTRGLTIRIGNQRTQAEIDWARAATRLQKLEIENQQLRQEMERLRSAPPNDKAAPR